MLTPDPNLLVPGDLIQFSWSQRYALIIGREDINGGRDVRITALETGELSVIWWNAITDQDSGIRLVMGHES